MPRDHIDVRPADVDVVLCDLDGVVWLDRRPIAGAVHAIERMRASGRRVLFVTNNSMSPVDDVEAALASVGIPAEGDVLTSAQAAALLIEPGERVLVAADAGVVQAVAARSAHPLRGAGHDGIDAVIVGLHRDFDFAILRAANTAIRSGARFIATNDDATFPTPDGPDPGGGSLVAAVRTAAETEPMIAGKPHRPMADLVANRCGSGFDPARVLMVGDRTTTDGRFAVAIGCPFALVRTGVTAPGTPVDSSVAPLALDVADLVAVADLFGGGADGVGEPPQ